MDDDERIAIVSGRSGPVSVKVIAAVSVMLAVLAAIVWFAGAGRGDGAAAQGTPGGVAEPQAVAAQRASPGRWCTGSPTPACTGVPPGTPLTSVADNVPGGTPYQVTAPGTVLDGVHIGGDLLVEANNVTVRNSQIDGTVYNKPVNTAYSFTITDSTVGPASGCISQPGVNEANYTAIRVLIRGHDDGFRISEPGNVTVRDSYVTLCSLPPDKAPPDGSHPDGIQSYCPDGPCVGLNFSHNTVDTHGIPATFMVNLEDPNLSDVTVHDNLLAGGAYTIVTRWHSGPVWSIHDNRIVDNSWAYGAASAEGTCTHQDWVGNQIVTIDNNYRVTSVIRPLSCQN